MNLTTTYPGQQLDSGTLEIELSSCGDKQDQCDGDIDNVIVASNDTDGDITAREVAAEEKHPTSSETSPGASHCEIAESMFSELHQTLGLPQKANVCRVPVDVPG